MMSLPWCGKRDRSIKQPFEQRKKDDEQEHQFSISSEHSTHLLKIRATISPV
jgi:hypothetical protein